VEFLREGFAVQDTLHPDRIGCGLPVARRGRRSETVLDEIYAAPLRLPGSVVDRVVPGLARRPKP